mgnify:CR=1 FL=1
MNIPAGIAAEMALNQQAVAMSVVKQNAEADQKIAQILEQAVQSAPVSQTRGSNLNITA